eukprot:gene6045-7006_t
MRELDSRFCSGIWGHNFQVQGSRRYQKSFTCPGSILINHSLLRLKSQLFKQIGLSIRIVTPKQNTV